MACPSFACIKASEKQNLLEQADLTRSSVMCWFTRSCINSTICSCSGSFHKWLLSWLPVAAGNMLSYVNS